MPRQRSSESKSGEKVGPSRTFEEALADVEQTVAKLEGGRLGLEESLDEYERGVSTLKECHRLLGSAERRITLLSGFDADGNPVVEDFDVAETTLPSGGESDTGRKKGGNLNRTGDDQLEDDTNPGLF